MNTVNFSTRSEIKTRSHEKVPGVHIIGLDMGYSGPKCYHENGNFVFPNFCKKITGDLFGNLGKNDIVYENIETGEKYCVGEMAIKSLTDDTVVAEDALFGRNHYLHPDFKVVFEASLGLALWDIATDGADVFLQTGLPPAYMLKDETYLRMVVEGNHHFKLTVANLAKTFDITINKDMVDVMSQPMGTFNSLLFEDNGAYTHRAAELMRSNLLLFDNGFRTLDTFFVKANQLESKDSNNNLGMHRIFEEVRKELREELGTDVGIIAMQNVLKTGTVKVNDLATLSTREYSIEKYLERANEKVCKEAIDSIKDYIFDIKFLIMTGGTSDAWLNMFKEKLAAAEVEILTGKENSNLPLIYQNARGYYLNALHKFKMRK